MKKIVGARGFVGVGRREFLRAAGTSAAALGLKLGFPSMVAAQRGPASDRVRLGVIGFGARGLRLARAAASALRTEVVAVADLYDGRLRLAREVLGDSVQAHRDYRRTLDLKDVDAVVIATPDHWHAPLLLQAAAAGKDVYCESPLTHSLEEGPRVVKAVEERGTVLQVGGGRITSPLYAAARDIVASGRLGRVTMVTGVWNTGTALQAWQTPFPPDASPESIDFGAFLGSAPRREFDLHRFFRWRRYWDYGAGLAGDRFAPQLGAVHWLLGTGPPERATASGAIRRWKDGREVPDTFVAVYEYAEGLTASLTASQNGGGPPEMRLIGTEATMVIGESRLAMYEGPVAEPYPEVAETWPKEYREWFYMMHGLSRQGHVRGVPDVQKAVEEYEATEGAGSAAVHLADFVECVRSRKPPKENLRLGLGAALAAHMANEAYRQGRSVGREDPRPAGSSAA